MSKPKIQVARLNPNQHIQYWNAVEIMQNTLGSVCPAVYDLYPQVENASRTFVALNDSQKVVGGLLWKYYEKPKIVDLKFMAVDPELHGQGIGRALESALVKHTKQCIANGAEIKGITLDANHTNYIFYRKLGYSFVGPRPKVEICGPIEMMKGF